MVEILINQVNTRELVEVENKKNDDTLFVPCYLVPVKENTDRKRKKEERKKEKIRIEHKPN